MSEILEQLHQDHKNFAMLLRFLERQLERLDACADVDLELLLDAIRYMKEYPDSVHHPLEEIVFDYYVNHFEDTQQEIESLRKEHASLPLLTERLINMIEGALMDVPQERQALVDCLYEYITAQHKHIDCEEATVYPELCAKMHEQDWEQISPDLAKVKDPLFGKQVADSFQKLCYSLSS